MVAFLTYPHKSSNLRQLRKTLRDKNNPNHCVILVWFKVRELKSQIDELMANLGAQKEKLSQQKMEHETEVSTFPSALA